MNGVLCEGVEVRYAMIDKLCHTHPIAKLCQRVNVAKSGYQTWPVAELAALGIAAGLNRIKLNQTSLSFRDLTK